VASAATFAFSFVASFIIAKVIDVTMGLRVTEADEITGLDLSQHAENGYSFGETASSGGVVSHAADRPNL
jgi:Amt family ammonium transporter